MEIQNVTSEGWAWFLVVVLVLLNAYNVFSAARKNAREEKARKSKPTDDLSKKLGDYARMLDSDKRRLDEHERQLADIRRGQMVNCAGTQALLEHALHNGNTSEMEEASREIDKWLRERP